MDNEKPEVLAGEKQAEVEKVQKEKDAIEKEEMLKLIRSVK